jgi:hypothetical protein
VDAALDVATAVGQFASGDIVGGIGSAISGIAKGVKALFGESAEEKAFKERIKKTNEDAYLGEFKINELYRERALEQIRMNETRLVGIAKETAELNKQKNEVAQQFLDLE